MTTMLPVATDYTSPTATQGNKKAFMTAVRAFLADLLGVDGTVATAREALGVGALTSVNRVVNGDCNVAQVSSGTAVPGVALYCGPDQYEATINGGGVGSFVQGLGSLTYGGVLKNTVRQTVVTPGSYTGSNYWGGITQKIEGLNVYDLKGKKAALSFIFNTNIGGTYTACLRDGTVAQSYLATFTAVANTPVKVTVPVAAIPLSANIGANPSVGLLISIGAQNSATYASGTLGSWQAGNFLAATGATGWLGTAGNFIELTDLQLAEGGDFTFAKRPYAVELALCCRYFRSMFVHLQGYQVAGNGFAYGVSWPDMRATPVVTFAGGSYSAANTISAVNVTASSARVGAVAAATGAVQFNDWTMSLDARM